MYEIDQNCVVERRELPGKQAEKRTEVDLLVEGVGLECLSNTCEESNDKLASYSPRKAEALRKLAVPTQSYSPRMA